MAHHYVYGSGQPGCLYDNGPHTSDTLENAIDALIETFNTGNETDLTDEEQEAMRNDLTERGVHYFARPQDMGAQYCEVTQYESDPKIAALAEHLGESYGSIEDKGSDHYECSERSGEWLVLTDDEADGEASAYLDSYMDDCLEIPDWIRPYFDAGAWKADVLRADGRGPQLSPYDGEESDVTIDGVSYYIYRVN